MAMITCWECSGQLSEHAMACPHCGAPANQPLKADANPATSVTEPVVRPATGSTVPRFHRRRKHGAIIMIVFWILGGLAVWFTFTRIPIGKATVFVKEANTLFGREFHFLWEPVQNRAGQE